VRATLVEAGIPTSVTATAALPAYQGNQVGSPYRAKNPQRSIVATEAQVPGPGLPNPAPKNVAITHAQAGAFVVPISVGVPAIFVRVAILFLPDSFHAFNVFRIGDRTGNQVPATGPFPKIDQAASIAAEGEFRVISQDEVPACRTP
jgi:hypothetical protein